MYMYVHVHVSFMTIIKGTCKCIVTDAHQIFSTQIVAKSLYSIMIFIVFVCVQSKAEPIILKISPIILF